MKFAIDIRGLDQKPAGKQRVVLKLLDVLIRLDRLNTYLLLADQPLKLPFPLPKNFKRRVESGWGIFWHLRIAQLLEEESVDVYLAGLSYIVPAVSRVPSLLIVYDLVAFTHPETTIFFKRLIEQFTLARALRHAGAVVCISRATRQKLLTLFSHKVVELVEQPPTVIYTAVDARFVPVTNQSLLHSVQANYQLPEKFILFVGTVEPRKNIPTLLEAYWQLPKKIRSKYGLVIAGKKGWKHKEVFSTIRHLELSKEVRYIDYVADEHLPALYSLSTVFVLPSWSEGFGLPVLEAMSCGVPVVASEVDALAEVVGRAGLLFDPHNSRQLKDRLELLLTHRQLRQRLGKLGQRRAKDFSWESSGKAVWELLKQLGQRKRQAIER